MDSQPGSPPVIHTGGGARAAIFDFNGTLSDDESLLYSIYAEMFASRGRPLSREQYVTSLAGLSDEEIIHRWLGQRDDLDELIRERVNRYRAAAGGEVITAPVRRAVRFAAARVPVAVVSGATSVEIDGVLQVAGIRDAFSLIVGAEQVQAGKPDPAGYLMAIAELRRLVDGIGPAEVVAFEDTEAGIGAAKAAGLRCVAITGTMPRERLAGADEIVDALDEALLARLFG